MNHAEWVRKVKELEDRIESLGKVGMMGPSELIQIESVLDELEKLMG